MCHQACNADHRKIFEGWDEGCNMVSTILGLRIVGGCLWSESNDFVRWEFYILEGISKVITESHLVSNTGMNVGKIANSPYNMMAKCVDYDVHPVAAKPGKDRSLGIGVLFHLGNHLVCVHDTVNHDEVYHFAHHWVHHKTLWMLLSLLGIYCLSDRMTFFLLSEMNEMELSMQVNSSANILMCMARGVCTGCCIGTKWDAHRCFVTVFDARLFLLRYAMFFAFQLVLYRDQMINSPMIEWRRWMINRWSPLHNEPLHSTIDDGVDLLFCIFLVLKNA